MAAIEHRLDEIRGEYGEPQQPPKEPRSIFSPAAISVIEL
jgi:hypothetical protein